MIQALGQTFGFAVGTAVFPVPTIAVILMLFSPAAGRDAGLDVRVDDFSGPRAFGLGLLLAAVNPKNLGLTVAAVASIGSAGLDSARGWLVVNSNTVMAVLFLVLGAVILGQGVSGLG